MSRNLRVGDAGGDGDDMMVEEALFDTKEAERRTKSLENNKHCMLLLVLAVDARLKKNEAFRMGRSESTVSAPHAGV